MMRSSTESNKGSGDTVAKEAPVAHFFQIQTRKNYTCIDWNAGQFVDGKERFPNPRFIVAETENIIRTRRNSPWLWPTHIQNMAMAYPYPEHEKLSITKEYSFIEWRTVNHYKPTIVAPKFEQ